MIDGIIEGSSEKLVGRLVFKTETSSVLRAMAVAGHGVAWLTESVANEVHGELCRLGSDEWSARLDIVAFRDKNARLPTLDHLWAQLCDKAVGSGGA